MRMIDADAIVTYLNDWALAIAPTGTENIRESTKRVVEYNAIQGAIDSIVEAPTIDAIPVEWMNQKYAENEPGEDKDYDYFLWDAIAYVLTEWQKEQEAR